MSTASKAALAFAAIAAFYAVAASSPQQKKYIWMLEEIQKDPGLQKTLFGRETSSINDVESRLVGTTDAGRKRMLEYAQIALDAGRKDIHDIILAEEERRRPIPYGGY